MTHADTIAIIIALIASLPTLIVVILQARKSVKNVTATAEKLQEIHVLVNSRLSDALTKIAILEGRLSDALDREHGTK